MCSSDLRAGRVNLFRLMRRHHFAKRPLLNRRVISQIQQFFLKTGCMIHQMNHSNVLKLKITKQPPSYIIGKNSCKIEVRGVSTAPGRESYRWLKKDEDSGDWVFLKDDSSNMDGIYYNGVNKSILVIHRYDHKEPPFSYDLYQCLIKDSSSA